MDVLTLSILFGMIVLSDEVLNGRLKLSQRLLTRIDRVGNRNKDRRNTPTQ